MKWVESADRWGRTCLQMMGCLVALLLVGCVDDARSRCENDDHCASGEVCRHGRCVAPGWNLDTGGNRGDRRDGDVAGTGEIQVIDSLGIEAPRLGELFSKTLTIENIGDGPLTIRELDINDSDRFSVSTRPRSRSLPLQLTSRESAELTVSFESNTSGRFTETLEIASDDRNQPRSEVKLIGWAGEDAGPCVELTAKTGIDFGRTRIGESANEPLGLKNCSSSEPLTIRHIEIEGASAFSTPMFEPTTIEPDAKSTVSVVFEPRRSKRYRANLVVETENLRVMSVSTTLRGRGAECPVADVEASLAGDWQPEQKVPLTVPPFEKVQLDGSSSSSRAGPITDYRWQIAKKPPRSQATLAPTNGAEQPTLTPRVVGEYEIELDVMDATGTGSCKSATRRIDVRPVGALYVELTWSTPGDPDETDARGTDLDLHYIRQPRAWKERRNDVWQGNRKVDWGQQDISADDPQFMRADSDGLGPESIRHRSTISGKTYGVGVYFSDDHGFGEVVARIRIYRKASTMGETLLEGNYTERLTEGDFWHVVDISQPAGPVRPGKVYPNGFPKR